MREDYTHIVMILDRSGSMSSIKSDTIGSLNEFVKTQREVEGKATFTLIQFDNEIETLQENVDIQEAKLLTEATFQPRGATALLDAINIGINKTDSYIAGLSDPGDGTDLNKYLKDSEKPSRVILGILTDGQENSSKEATKDSIMKLIQEREAQSSPKWEVIYLGANQDAIAEAATLGIAGGKTMTYAASGKGVDNSMKAFTANVSSYRRASLASASFEFSDEQRTEAMDQE